MLIIGAKGFAKEVLEILNQLEQLENIAFYDDISTDINGFLYNKFPVLKTADQAKQFFTEHGNTFTIGVGSPVLRNMLYHKFTALGGSFGSVISPFARIGSFGNKVGQGCNIMTNVIITNDVQIGIGVLINLNCTVGHDSIIEDFVELSPGVHVSGNCKVGRFSNLGTNSTILPKVTLGENVVVGAGAVVTKDVPSNSLVVGIPAKVVKELDSLEFIK